MRIGAAHWERASFKDTVALEADGSCSSESLLTGRPDGRGVIAHRREAMRDVLALEAAAGSSESSPTWVSAVAVLQLQIDNNWIRCSVCSQNLLYIKCPVFQCKSGHLACVLCRAEPCKNCKDGGAKFLARNEVAEHVILCARFAPRPPHRGCHGFFTYSEVTAHNDACPQAPCSCAMPGCGFAGPPHALLRHLVSLHSWPAYGARYGKVLSLRVPASAVPCRRLILAVNDARVFALVVGKQCRDTAFSLVCVRACASPWPSYKARLRACVLRQSGVVAGSTRTVAMQMVASSSRPGEVVVQKQPCVLRVPQTYQNTGDEGSEEVFLKIGIVIFPIDK